MLQTELISRCPSLLAIIPVAISERTTTLKLLTAMDKVFSVQISVGEAGHGLALVFSLLSVLQHTSMVCISSTLPSATFNFCSESNESQLRTANLYAYHSKSSGFVFFNTLHPRKIHKPYSTQSLLPVTFSHKILATKARKCFFSI